MLRRLGPLGFVEQRFEERAIPQVAQPQPDKLRLGRSACQRRRLYVAWEQGMADGAEGLREAHRLSY